MKRIYLMKYAIIGWLLGAILCAIFILVTIEARAETTIKYKLDQMPTGTLAGTSLMLFEDDPSGDKTTVKQTVADFIAYIEANSVFQPILSEGAFVDGDKTKLDGIEAGADVTDAANVTAAGARMDSEYPQREFTVASNPDDIEHPASVWVDYVEISGGSDGDVLTISETNAADGKSIVITNTGAVYYVFEDLSASLELPRDKSVKLLPSDTIEVYYSNLAWHLKTSGEYDLVIAHRDFGSPLTVDGTYSGNTITMTVDAGQSNTLFGQAYHIDTDGELIEADADVATSGAAPAVCLAVTAGTGASKLCLIQGQICETAWNWTIGGKVYLGDDPTTTTGLTQTAPSTEGDRVQPLGIALSADTIFFSPTLDTVGVPAP